MRTCVGVVYGLDFECLGVLIYIVFVGFGLVISYFYRGVRI